MERESRIRNEESRESRENQNKNENEEEKRAPPLRPPPGGKSLLGGRRGGFFRPLHKLEREGIDSVALAGRGRAVVEDVAQVAGAAGAGGFQVGMLVDRARKGVPERGPAAGVVLGLGVVELLAAAGAGVEAVALVVQQLAGVGVLGPLLAEDVELLGGELLLPLRLARGQRLGRDGGGVAVHAFDLGFGGLHGGSSRRRAGGLAGGQRHEEAQDHSRFLHLSSVRPTCPNDSKRTLRNRWRSNRVVQ